MQDVFPWQKDRWQYLVKRMDALQMPHAILLQGRDGLGKNHFALCLANLLLCSNPNKKEGRHCGCCDACKLFDSNNHPDLIILKPESAGKAIKIDQVRSVISNLSNTSHQGEGKVVIIECAELLNISSSNALLKTLEEPEPNTVIILVTAHPMTLAATIRSRCQVLDINAPEYSIAEDWLKKELGQSDVSVLLSLTENAPLKAISLVNDGGLDKRQEFFKHLNNLDKGKINLVKISSECSKLGLDYLILSMMYVICDMIKLHFGNADTIINRDQIELLNYFSEKSDLDRMFAYKDRLTELKGYLSGKINLNQQIVSESLLLDWMDLFL